MTDEINPHASARLQSIIERLVDIVGYKQEEEEE